MARSLKRRIRGPSRCEALELGAMASRRSMIAANCSENMDLIDEDGSGDLDAAEVKTLLAAMGISQREDVEDIVRLALQGHRRTNHLRVTDAILECTELDEAKIQMMLGRVALFGKAFRWLDFDQNGTLSLHEIVRMMELLNIDRGLAGDLMAYLDSDDSGEITWQEFVRGVCSPEFSSLFPQITLEALVELPSSLRANKAVSPEEEKKAIEDLPAIEKSLYWIITVMYGSGRREEPNLIDVTRFEDRSPEYPEVPLPKLPEEPLEVVDLESKPRVRLVAELPCIVRKEPRHPEAVRPAVVHPNFPKGEVEIPWLHFQNSMELSQYLSGSRAATAQSRIIANVPCIVRKEPRTPNAVKTPVHAAPGLQWDHFPKPRAPARVGWADDRRPSNNSYGVAAAAAAVSSAVNDIAHGLASAFGLQSKKTGMSVADAASMMKSMDVKVTKAHVLNEQKRLDKKAVQRGVRVFMLPLVTHIPPATP